MPGVPRETRVKLVLLGDTGVGKSAIVVRFVQGEFSEESKVTVGAAFLAKSLLIPEHGPDASVKFEIWDTAGQGKWEGFHSQSFFFCLVVCVCVC